MFLKGGMAPELIARRPFFTFFSRFEAKIVLKKDLEQTKKGNF